MIPRSRSNETTAPGSPQSLSKAAKLPCGKFFRIPCVEKKHVPRVAKADTRKTKDEKCGIKEGELIMPKEPDINGVSLRTQPVCSACDFLPSSLTVFLPQEDLQYKNKCRSTAGCVNTEKI